MSTRTCIVCNAVVPRIDCTRTGRCTECAAKRLAKRAAYHAELRRQLRR